MRKHKEIECLKKLEDEIHCFEEMMDFLLKEKIIDINTHRTLQHELARELPYTIHHILDMAIKEERIQLLDYHWELLPQEKICITIITNMTKKDFIWSH